MSRFASSRRPVSLAVGLLLGALALYPTLARQLARHQASIAATRLQASLQLRRRNGSESLDPALSLRVQRLSPLLASWETVGGCGAGSSGGTGTVKWIGHGTSGGLFQNITQLNYTALANGPNLTLTTQFTRDLTDQWNVGVLVPFVYKRFNDYMGQAFDVENSGLGDINLLGAFRFGPINATSLSLTLGLPTGTHAATIRNDLLTEEKQLGLGRVTGSLTLDHTLDETWGVIVLGGLLSYRGGQNELGNYRAPFASAYGYAGYFLGPLVPSLGLSLTGFTDPDRDRGIDQDVPLMLVSANASLEWSTDWIAVLAGVSVPFGLYSHKGMSTNPNQQSALGLQPWTAAIGVSISPF